MNQRPCANNVVYVAGSMRSGTTLLGDLLSDVFGWMHVGELHDVWEAMANDSQCSCGNVASRCQVWSRAMKLLAQSNCRAKDPAHIQDLVSAELRYRNWLAVRGRPFSSPSGDVYEQIRCAYRALFDAFGAAGTVIVDSSKTAPQLTVRMAQSDLRLTVVHLVRDPRGVVASDLRSLKAATRPDDPPGRSLFPSIANWTIENELLRSAISGHPRTLLVTYEQLVQDPGEVLGRVSRAVGVGECEPAWSGASRHVLVGNPGRFSRRVGNIRPDLRWMEELTHAQQLAILAATAPTRRRLRRRLVDSRDIES